MLGLIFIGVGIVLIFDAAHPGCFEITVGLGFILFGIIGLFAG